MIPAFRQAATRAIFVSLIVRGEVTRQCPQTTTFEEGARQPKSGIEPASSAYQFNALHTPLGQIGLKKDWLVG